MSSRKPSLQPSFRSRQDSRTNEELLELTARLKASYLKRENGLIESRNARRVSHGHSDVIVQVEEVESPRGVTNPLLTPVSARSATPSAPQVQTSYSTLPIQRRGSPDSQAISSVATSSNGHHARVKPALRPICTSIRICGLQWRSAESKAFDGHTVHGIIVSGVVTIAFALFFIMYRKDDRVGPELAKKVATHVWQLQALLTIPSFQYTFMRYFPRLVKRWDSYKRKHTGAPLHMMTSFTYRATAIVDALFALTVSIFIMAFTIGQVELVTYQIRAFYPDNHVIVPPYIAFLFFLFNGGLMFIWMQPLLFLFVVSVLLRREFMELNKNFKAALALGMESRSKRLDVEGYRHRHIALCRLTDKLDDMIAPYLCINYVLGLPLVCGLIYSLLTADAQSPEHMAHVGAAALTSVMPIVHLIVATLIGAALTYGARSPMRIVLDLDLRACTPQEAVSLQVFTSKVAFEHVGLTVWKIINVDKPLLIVVFVVVGTYVCILLKIGICIWANQLLSEGPAEGVALVNNTQTTPPLFVPVF